MQYKEMRGTLTHQAWVPAAADAATDDAWPVFVAPAKIQITGVKFVPSAGITANGTNHSTYALVNKGTGSSSVSVATRAWSATNSVASTPENFTLSATAANLIVEEGHSLDLVKTHAGTGLVIPDGNLVISYVFAGV